MKKSNDLSPKLSLFLFETKLKKKIFRARININFFEPEASAYPKCDHIVPVLKSFLELLWMPKALFSYREQVWAQFADGQGLSRLVKWVNVIPYLLTHLLTYLLT